MTIYYSKTNKGFYDSAIHKTLPNDAVEISKELHSQLLSGGEIDFDTTPPSNKPAPLPDYGAMVRFKRDQLLAASDWSVLTDSPLSKTQKMAWIEYRQALRDVPNQDGFPENVIFPEVKK